MEYFFQDQIFHKVSSKRSSRKSPHKPIQIFPRVELSYNLIKYRYHCFGKTVVIDVACRKSKYLMSRESCKC